ncbi:MAG: hypothetical protein JW797_04690 [Bradymonadales bacterium]|nr:hypothetical protein [Bradymonadales bacterium]
MPNFDFTKLLSDKIRLIQLICLGGIALFGLLTVIVEAGALKFILMLLVLGFIFFSIAPVYLRTLEASSSTIGRAGYYGLKAAEAAGLAGIAVIVLGIFTAIGSLTNKGQFTHMICMVLFLVQAVTSIGMAVGLGLTTMLRANGVELELPPEPQPKPVQPAYPPGQPPYPGYPQGYPQGYPPQGYPQPPQGQPQPAEAPPAEVPPAPEGETEK